MRRRGFLLLSIVGGLAGTLAIPARRDGIVIRDGWILLESDLQ